MKYVAFPLVLAASAPAMAAHKPMEVAVMGPDVNLSDLGPALHCALPQASMGKAPAVGGSRLILRDDLRARLGELGAKTTCSFPESIRLVRKSRTFSSADVQRLAEPVVKGHLPRGVALVRVKPLPTKLLVPDGYDAIEAEVAPPPRRRGPHAITVLLSFRKGGETLFETSLPIDIQVSEEALIPDIRRGSGLTLVFRKGLVEVGASAVAHEDGYVGATIPVTVRTTQKRLRAKVVDKEHAVAVDP